MTESIRVYYKLKCDIGQIALAWHSTTYNRNTGKKLREHISLFLPRVWMWHQREGVNWDKLLTHTLSHEYMHKVIHDLEGRRVSNMFDNIAGTLSKDKNKIGIGMSINIEE